MVQRLEEDWFNSSMVSWWAYGEVGLVERKLTDLFRLFMFVQRKQQNASY